MREVDLGWIRAFVEVVQAGSLSAAARNLNMTQPAISYQIRRAEDEFGTPLLRRLHRGVEPTEAGARLAEVLSRCVTQVDQLALRLRDKTAPTALRLFTDYAFSGLWLIPRIHRFREANPDFDIQIIASQRTELSQLQDRDTAVVFGARKEFGPEAILLMPETVVPVCAPGYPLRDLTKANLIHLDSPRPAHWFDWAHYLKACACKRDLLTDHGHLRFNAYPLVIDAAVAGQGIALGWRGLVEPLLQQGRLVEAGSELTAPERGYFMVQGSPRDAATTCLQDWLLTASAP